MALQQVFMTNLKKHRKETGFTQEKLAEMCNSDPCYIRQIENGRRFPSVGYIEKLAIALNIAPYRLFYEETENENEKTDALSRDQKKKIKALLVENVSNVCSLIDEKY
jgi:transcriptional regulator with XRE-family HTH domain